MKKTTELQGKMQEIQFKYKNNPELMNKESWIYIKGKI